jgi:hypothetical protein
VSIPLTGGKTAFRSYMEGMMDLIIGLCFGVVSAVALVVMWRVAGRLRKEVQPREGEPIEPEVARPGQVADDRR